ncbi:MAG: cation:proton antiporter, partial [Haliea sp.]
MIADPLWFLIVGGMMLARGLTATALRHSPITPAIFYLALGLVLGPSILNLFHFNPLQESALLEVLTEIVVLISLFAAGVKMPAPIQLSRWRAPVLLASVSMGVSVGMVAAFAYFVLGLPIGAGVLLGAILAPTDPVLATDVQTRHPGDREPLRFTLTCEAGMNDGSAFPFVMLGLGLLGLHDLGEFNLRWILVDVIWATAAGVAIGLISGMALAHLARRLSSPDVERAAGAAVVARWGLPVELRTPALHLRVDVHERTCHVGVQYTAEALTRRLPRIYSPPALLRLAEPDPRAPTRILDPFCGSGTILLEAAAWLPEAALFGSDLNPRAVAGTLRNARALDAADGDAGAPAGPSAGASVEHEAGSSAARSVESRLDVRAGDARALVEIWGEASMSHVVTNPPFGVRLGKEIDFVGFYRRILSEVVRVLVPGGTLVMLVL